MLLGACAAADQIPKESLTAAVYDDMARAPLQAAEPSGPIYAIVRSYKHGFRKHIVNVLDEGRRNRAELADQIVSLLDGGAVTKVI